MTDSYCCNYCSIRGISLNSADNKEFLTETKTHICFYFGCNPHFLTDKNVTTILILKFTCSWK